MADITLEQAKEMLIMAAQVVDREGEVYRPMLAYAEAVFTSKLAQRSQPAQSETERIRALLAA